MAKDLLKYALMGLLAVTGLYGYGIAGWLGASAAIMVVLAVAYVVSPTSSLVKDLLRYTFMGILAGAGIYGYQAAGWLGAAFAVLVIFAPVYILGLDSHPLINGCRACGNTGQVRHWLTPWAVRRCRRCGGGRLRLRFGVRAGMSQERPTLPGSQRGRA